MSEREGSLRRVVAWRLGVWLLGWELGWLLVASGAAVAAQQAPEAPTLTMSELLTAPGRSERAIPRELEYKVEALDPGRDGWTTEVISAALNARLKKFAHLLESAPESAQAYHEFLTADFSTSPLVPRPLRTRYEAGGLEVLRPAGPRAERRSLGAAGLAAEVGRWQVTPSTDEVRVEVKILGIEVAEGTAETPVQVQTVYTHNGRLMQQNALWHVTWRTTDDPPRLQSIAVHRFEEVRAPGPQPLFEDVTAAVLGNDRTLIDQMSHGRRWDQELDVALGSQLLGHFGLAVADVNGDGREDVYVAQPGGLPNRLLLQREDGTVEDASAAAGLDYLDGTTSALFADLDNDGDQDLIVALGPVVFHENVGGGKFEARRAFATDGVYSMALADYDSDRRLDLFLCRYGSPTQSMPVPYHDANNGVPNVLLRQVGDWQFEDVTKAVGLDVNNRRYSFAAGWADYDDDGDLDLYVANDFGRNNLYRNDGGKFTDVAREAGVEDQAAGMSVAWSDFDNDGKQDLYVANMFSAAGRRTTFQRNFKADASAEERAALQRLSRGNSLFRNAGNGTFSDVSAAAGVTGGRWAWSSKFADLNNDGWDDLVVANGYVTNDDDDDL